MSHCSRDFFLTSFNSRDQQGMCGFHKKCTWINSSVIVSAEKTGNTSTATTLSMLKIYSRCLIQLLKVKYTEFKFSYFIYIQQFHLPNSLPNGLPAIRPGSTMARAPIFHTIKVITSNL